MYLEVYSQVKQMKHLNSTTSVNVIINFFCKFIWHNKLK